MQHLKHPLEPSLLLLQPWELSGDTQGLYVSLTHLYAEANGPFLSLLEVKHKLTRMLY